MIGKLQETGEISKKMDLSIQDEIVIIIRNGKVVRFIQHDYDHRLQGLNGEGI